MNTLKQTLEDVGIVLLAVGVPIMLFAFIGASITFEKEVAKNRRDAATDETKQVKGKRYAH